MREKWEKGFVRKTELEGRVMWESQMRKGGKQYPEKQAPCARLSVVSFCLTSILVLSHFWVAVLVFRLFCLCFPLLSRGALCSVVGSIPGRELIYQFQNKIVLRSECRTVLHICAKQDSFFHKTARFNPGHVRTIKPGPIWSYMGSRLQSKRKEEMSGI